MKHAFYSRSYHRYALRGGIIRLYENDRFVGNIPLVYNVFKFHRADGVELIATHILFHKKSADVLADAVYLGEVNEAAACVELPANTVSLMDY